MGSDHDFPWCTIFLAVGALICHSLVLAGNMHMASKVDTLGSSSYGWADVGVQLSTSMNSSLELKMHQATVGMTETVALIMTARTLVDDILSNASQMLPVAEQTSLTQQDSTRSNAMDINATDVLIEAVTQLKEAAHKILDAVKPVLLQVQRWLVSFGDRVQTGIEVFTLTLDTAQQIFDQIMVQMKGPGKNEDVMLHHTYDLFDASNTGKVSAADLADVASLYGIAALQDDKGAELFKKYDADEDHSLSATELKLLSRDSDVQGVLALVLRAYARRLLAAAGNVANAKSRDEVARTVVQYMSIVCVKNETKVQWLAHALTNGSLPLEFTSSVLANLALASENPAQLTTQDVGALYTERLAQVNAEYLASAVSKMKEVDFWKNEGLDLKDQPRCVETVAKWVTQAKKAPTALPALMAAFREDPSGTGGRASHVSTASASAEDDDDQSTFMQCDAQVQANEVPDSLYNQASDHQSLVQTHLRRVWLKKGLADSHVSDGTSGRDAQHSDSLNEAALKIRLPGLARQHVEEQHRQHRHTERMRRARRKAEQHAALALFDSSAPGALSLLRVRRMLAAADDDSDAARVVNGGVPAQEETLRFARFLSYNATRTAEMLQHECFEYTSQADGPVENVATRITGMVKAIQSVLAMIKEHATPRAIQKIESQIDAFAGVLENDLLKRLQAEKDKLQANTSFEQMSQAAGDPGSSLLKVDPVQKMKSLANKGGNAALQLVIQAWMQIKPLLDSLISMFPPSINYMKVARQEVSTVSQILKSQFSIFRFNGQPIFDQGAAIQRKVWIVYFVLFVVFTLTMPLYALWSAGKLGGPGSAPREGRTSWEGYQAPTSYRERCAVCWTSCCSCCRECHTTYEFLWSFVILMELLWLPLLLASLLFSVLVTVEAFVKVGCSPVYILQDNLICTESLQTISDFLDSLSWMNGMNLESVCGARSLLVCKILGQDMFSYVLCTVIGSFVATFLCLQMILDSAARWERHRYERLLSEAGVDKF